MKKPDRWERMVDRLSNHTLDESAMTIRIGKANIAKLLRQEHRWVERMVLKELKSSKPKMDIYGQHCMHIQARDILTKLKDRSK